ncbi:MGDG synthase family glycosyltransferase [Clostridium sp. DL1XJH146]
MKTVLVLTASTGEGHNQAADSLKKKYEKIGYNAVKYDFLKNTTMIMNSFIVDGYEILAKYYPKIYGNIYKMSDKKSINDILFKRLFIIVQKKIMREIFLTQPDLIVGTHPLSVSVISRLKQKEIIRIPFISVVTDFKAHYTYVDHNVDAYITGSVYTKETLINKGIPAEKIYPFGIPVREEFLCENEIKESEEDKFSILLMGGSMGLKAMEDILEDIMSNINHPKVTVVCGRNEKLERKLHEKYKGRNIIILGFTKSIPELMGKHSLIVTKPGGLTVSEAINKEIPMIIPFAIPGQEEENTQFLVESGAALELKHTNNINEMIDLLVNNEQMYDDMKDSIKKIRKNYSLDNFVEVSEKLIANYSGKIKINASRTKKVKELFKKVNI